MARRDKIVDEINRLYELGLPMDREPIKELLEELERIDAEAEYWENRKSVCCED